MSSEAPTEKNISLLIVVKTSGAIKSAVKFLERRGVTTTIVESMKEAIAAATASKPDFVMLSINLTGSTTVKALHFLATTMNLKVIAFGEMNDSMTSANLDNLETEHTMHGPLSGPKIFMRLQKIVRDAQKKEEGAHEEETATRVMTEGSASSVTESNIRIKGMSGSGGVIFQKGNRGQAFNENQDGIEGPGANFHDSESEAENKSGAYLAKSRELRREEDIPEDTPGGNLALEAALGADLEPHENADITIDPAKPSSRQTHTPSKDEDKVQGPPTISSKANRDTSMLADSAQIVLRETTKATTTEIIRVQETRSVAAITVNSPRFKGYLLAALGRGRLIDKEFLDSIKQRLLDHLRKKGEVLSKKETDFQVEIEKVEFASWAEEYADFLASAQQGDSELALAFISGEDAIPYITASTEAHMLAVELKDAPPGVRVDFDVFLYLPKNARYIRYIAIGAYISEEQQTKLRNMNVEHLHIRAEDEAKFKTYCGRNFIRKKVGA